MTTLHDVAVVIPTTLEPCLVRAVRSVYAQSYPGMVQIMVGVDVPKGNRDVLETLRAECPDRMRLTPLDLGYSTSARHGGFYRNSSGGALRTILSYAANARYLAYLDDDNWWAPSHLSVLLAAIKGHGWAWSLRWYVHPRTLAPIAVDRWESVGPDRGIYAKRFGGFVDTNCPLLDKRNCHWLVPAWCLPENNRGAGVDRLVFERLRKAFNGAATGKATAYYVVRRADVATIRHFMTRAAARRARRNEPVRAKAAEAS